MPLARDNDYFFASTGKESLVCGYQLEPPSQGGSLASQKSIENSGDAFITTPYSL